MTHDTLRITVGELEQLRNHARDQIRAAEAPDRDPEEIDAFVLSFGTYEELVKRLSPARVELIRTIARECPESIRATARLVDRDVSDVHDDLQLLEALEVIELEAGGPGEATRPIVPYERVEFDLAMHFSEGLETAPDAAEV